VRTKRQAEAGSSRSLEERSRVLATKSMTRKVDIKMSTESVRTLKQQRHDYIRSLSRHNMRRISTLREKDSEYRQKLRQAVLSSERTKDARLRAHWHHKRSFRQQEMQAEGRHL
jgi:hypothetical protein